MLATDASAEGGLTTGFFLIRAILDCDNVFLRVLGEEPSGWGSVRAVFQFLPSVVMQTKGGNRSGKAPATDKENCNLNVINPTVFSRQTDKKDPSASQCISIF